MAKTIHALGRSATVIGTHFQYTVVNYNTVGEVNLILCSDDHMLLVESDTSSFKSVNSKAISKFKTENRNNKHSTLKKCGIRF
jgi:hypothetical protein